MDLSQYPLSEIAAKVGTPFYLYDAAILREITTKGSASRFRKTDRGRFALAG